MGFDLSRLGEWGDLVFFADDLPAIEARLADDPRQILPPRDQVFAALELTQPRDVRVVILGQDPYPTPGHAHGLAFSAAADVHPLPRSLANIYRELQADLGAAPPNADLHFWARQGVLLLNTVLTVPAGAANQHAKLGWQALTSQVLDRLATRPTAYLLWGKAAQGVAAGVDAKSNLKLESSHPSPYSAHISFLGSRCFSQVNTWLRDRGDPVINWTHPEAS